MRALHRMQEQVLVDRMPMELALLRIRQRKTLEPVVAAGPAYPYSPPCNPPTVVPRTIFVHTVAWPLWPVIQLCSYHLLSVLVDTVPQSSLSRVAAFAVAAVVADRNLLNWEHQTQKVREYQMLRELGHQIQKELSPVHQRQVLCLPMLQREIRQEG
jgi:hypothetical protein